MSWSLPDGAPPRKRKRALRIAAEHLGALSVPYVPFDLSGKQEAFIRLNVLEAFYGGAAGPGKSSGLLASALKYVDRPNYDAMLMRRTYTSLKQPNALMDMAQAWLGGNGPRYNQSDHQWTFPSGARLTFGYYASEADRERYKSAEYDFIGIDEVTGWTEERYLFMFSRLRRVLTSTIPTRMRSASNPGGIGHDWAKKRFVSPETRHPGAVFIRGVMTDNPGLDVAGYLLSLANLPRLERDRLIRGDWDAQIEGSHFRRADLELVEHAPAPVMLVRAWDLAATEPKNDADDSPDWTVGILYSRDVDDRYTIRDVIRLRRGPGEVERVVAATAAHDRLQWHDRVDITIPQDPAQAGKSQVEHFQLKVLRGYRVTPVRPTGSKEVRARTVAAAAQNHLVRVLLGPWPIEEFLSTIERFPTKGIHDDDVDALADAHSHVTDAGEMTWSTPAEQRIPPRQKRG